MRKRAKTPKRRKHILTDRMIALAAAALSRKIGYLRVEEFHGSSIFATLPTKHFDPKRVIRIEDGLYLVSGGVVQIRHSHHDYLVKELTPGALFGDMPLLGQTMLMTNAVAGAEGALVSFMSSDVARDWVWSNPIEILERIGTRLATIEAEQYRSSFQLTDSRVAAFLLELAGEGATVEGMSHEMIGDRLGMYRETVTVALDAMKLDGIVEIGRMKITLLDKRALQELSEL